MLYLMSMFIQNVLTGAPVQTDQDSTGRGGRVRGRTELDDTGQAGKSRQRLRIVWLCTGGWNSVNKWCDKPARSNSDYRSEEIAATAGGVTILRGMQVSFGLLTSEASSSVVYQKNLSMSGLARPSPAQPGPCRRF